MKIILLKFFFYTIFTYAVDMYALGRITKVSSSYQKNIIIYAGAGHSINYLNFFRQNSAIIKILKEHVGPVSPYIDYSTMEPVVHFSELDKQKSSFF